MRIEVIGDNPDLSALEHANITQMPRLTVP
jgi:hypothetical protein